MEVEILSQTKFYALLIASGVGPDTMSSVCHSS